jgi:hypothetical protein
MTTMHGSTIHLTARQADTLAVILTSRLRELNSALDADQHRRNRRDAIGDAYDGIEPMTPAVRTMHANERHDVRAMLLEVMHTAPV